MTLKRFSCRTHGGIFTMPARRGRPPVRCMEDYPCDKAEAQAPTKRAEIKSVVREVPGVGKVATVTGVNYSVQADAAAESNGAERSLDNPSLTKAKAAKERLEALGWSAQGKAGVGYAELNASRSEETLLMRWEHGVIVTEHYSTEPVALADDHLPGYVLKFDANELTDRELVQRISGMKVTWWNTLASNSETAIVGDKVQVEHIFDAGNGYDDGKRIVKFIDRGGHGFKAFHVSALLKVG